MNDLSHLIKTASRQEQERQGTLQRLVDTQQTRNREVERLDKELATLHQRLRQKEQLVETL